MPSVMSAAACLKPEGCWLQAVCDQSLPELGEMLDFDLYYESCKSEKCELILTLKPERSSRTAGGY